MMSSHSAQLTHTHTHMLTAGLKVPTTTHQGTTSLTKPLNERFTSCPSTAPLSSATREATYGRRKRRHPGTEVILIYIYIYTLYMNDSPLLRPFYGAELSRPQTHSWSNRPHAGTGESGNKLGISRHFIHAICTCQQGNSTVSIAKLRN